MAVAATPRKQQRGGAGGNNLGGGGSGGGSSASVILHAFTEAGQIHRWHLPRRKSISANLTNAGGGAKPLGGSNPGETGGGSGAALGSSLEGSGGQERTRAAAALPASSSFISCGGGGGGSGRQLILFAGDKGLVAVDAGRGVVVQELTGAGADELQSGSGEGGGGGGGRGSTGGVSHLAVTPDGKTVVSVGDVSFVCFLFVVCLVRPLCRFNLSDYLSAGCRASAPGLSKCSLSVCLSV